MDKDLTRLNKAIVATLEKELGIKNPAVIVAFTTSKDRSMVNWVSNTTRNDSIKILDSLSDRMKSQLN